MRNISRVEMEIKIACATFGSDRVQWARDYSWIRILRWETPPTINRPRTNILVIVPENYGYGEPFKDCFVDEGLEVWEEGRRRWVRIPHYFPAPAGVNEYYEEGWRYLCVHQMIWNPSRDNIITYLNQVYTFLSDPFRDWEE
jgi:hypothetical protein